MTYGESIKAVASDALTHVQDGHTLGLGSGRAASALVVELGKTTNTGIRGIPTSLQIKTVAEKNSIDLVEPDLVSHIDIAFDGADQIDAAGCMIKGGGGALLRESILIGMADMTIIMADETKFCKKLDAAVPVEIHPSARGLAARRIKEMGGKVRLRTLDRGYPMFTENGNIILDCNFGLIGDPPSLSCDMGRIPGVLSVGIFEKPDIMYKAGKDGLFDVIRSSR